MNNWSKRPREEANLLNPAFCCLGITAAVIGYQSTVPQGLPLGLTYMVLPITLHKPTRDILPNTRRTSLASWLQNNTSARVLFHQRLVSLKPFTNEAVIFGCNQEWLSIQNGASLKTDRANSLLNKVSQALDSEPHECIAKALFVGKWLAAAGSPATVMALWGIQP